MSSRPSGRAPPRRNRPGKEDAVFDMEDLKQRTFNRLPATMPASDRKLLATMPAKCMCCPREAVLGAQLLNFLEDTLELNNIPGAVHWGLNMAYNVRVQRNAEVLGSLLYAGGALPGALWLADQVVEVTPEMAGVLKVPAPSVPAGQLYDAPQGLLLATTARAVGLELLSVLMAYSGADFTVKERESTCMAALAGMCSAGSSHMERFCSLQVLDMVLLTAPHQQAADLLPFMVEVGLFEALVSYIRTTGSAAGLCGALQLLLNVMHISSGLRKALPDECSAGSSSSSSSSSSAGSSSKPGTSCEQANNPPWSMEVLLPDLALKGGVAAVSAALANARKLKPYTWAHHSWAHTPRDHAMPLAEKVLKVMWEGLTFMGYTPCKGGGGSSSSSKCDACSPGSDAAAVSTCSAGDVAGACSGSDGKQTTDTKKKKKKKKNKVAQQNADAGQQQLPGQTQDTTPAEGCTAARTPLADLTQTAHGSSSSRQQVRGASNCEDKPAAGGSAQVQSAAGNTPEPAAAADAVSAVVQQQQQQAEEEGTNTQQQGGEARLVLRTKDGKLLRPKQLRNMMHQMQVLGLG